MDEELMAKIAEDARTSVETKIENVRIDRRHDADGFWKVIVALGSSLGCAIGIIITLLLYMPQIKINTHRLDVLEADYKIDRKEVRDLLIVNGTKLDGLATALHDHEIETALGKQ